MATRANAKKKTAARGKIKSRGKVADLPRSALKGKGKKGQNKRGDNGGPGLTDAQAKAEINALNRAFADWEKDNGVAKQSKGVYQSRLKAAKKIGINTDAYVLARTLDRQDHGKVHVDHADAGRYLRIMGSTLASQLELFQNLEAPEVQAKVDANLQGQMAGKNAEPAENNPFNPGTDDFQSWAEGWATGQEMNHATLRH